MEMTEVLSFLAGAAVGGIISWLITHSYYVKSSREQKAQLDELAEQLKPKNTLDEFEQMLTASTWTKQTIGDSEVWIAEADNSFQIKCGERIRDFRERWTEVYPDQNGAYYPVYLSINNNILKELPFVSADGGRIFVPMPELRPVPNERPEYFWNMSSIELKVGRIIGHFYIYNNLEGVAQSSKIRLVD